VRVDRATGKAVFGIFPTADDPKASVIWEAFQPQTEPRRSYTAAVGDPYNQQQQQQRMQQLQQAARRSVSTASEATGHPEGNGLPTQNTL
jgi:penicillin-binding protein 1A